MPKGVYARRGYPIAMIGAVNQLYRQGMSQDTIAITLGISQKVVWRLMRQHGMRTRNRKEAALRKGANPNWKGSGACYTALHQRVRRQLGIPQKCEECGRADDTLYEWANQSGRYDEPSDYRRLCVRCHRRQDYRRWLVAAHSQKRGFIKRRTERKCANHPSRLIYCRGMCEACYRRSLRVLKNAACA